jgi:hypothetical protein
MAKPRLLPFLFFTILAKQTFPALLKVSVSIFWSTAQSNCAKRKKIEDDATASAMLVSYYFGKADLPGLA